MSFEMVFLLILCDIYWSEGGVFLPIICKCSVNPPLYCFHTTSSENFPNPIDTFINKCYYTTNLVGKYA